MRRIFTLGLSLVLGLSAYSQVLTQEHDFNKDITPYHDALDAQNGITGISGNSQIAWRNFISKYPSWGARFGRFTKLPHRAAGKAIVFSGGGNDPVAKAKAFMSQELGAFKIPLDELQSTRNYNDGKYINVDFKQIHQGKEILWSNVNVRFTQDLKIVGFTLDCYRNISDATIVLDANTAKHFAESAINTTIVNTDVDPSTKLFPLPTDKGFEMRPAYAVTVHTQDDKTTPGSYKTYVDAITGDILYRQNDVKHFGFKVKGDLYLTNLYGPMGNHPLKYLKVVQGGNTYYSDVNGVVTLAGAGPWNPTLSLEGKWCKIVTGANGTTVNSINPTNVNDGDSITYTQSSPDATERHLTCYYHVNEVHDYMKSKFPSFTGLDLSLLSRVDRTDGNCNAFYNGSSINFYTTANGCNALSLVSDVMYHEYGHGISDKFWTSQGSSFDNGAMGEGYSDTWAMCITKSPIIGPGFYINQPASYIRRYDINPKVYPNDIIGEVHADGEIIAGAWWDVAVNMSNTLSISMSDAVDTMSNIFAGSQFGLATGPDGQEGQVYFDILIDALQYDDNNNDITDGTPHFLDIVKAFGKHGIYLLSDSKLVNACETAQPAGAAFPVTAHVFASYPAFLGDVKMYYRVKGQTALDSLTLVTTNDTVYTATFPSSTAGTIYEFYYMATDVLGNKSAYGPIAPVFSTPFAQRNIPYYFAIGYLSMYLQNFEGTMTDWTIGNYTGDNATAGKWIVAVPISSQINGDTVQTGHDHSSGSGMCAVTGNAASASSSSGSADIDNGRTSMLSEEFDLSTYTNPVISYWRWFTNSQSPTTTGRKDRWMVYLMYPNSIALVERTFQPDVQWRQNLVPVDLSKGNKVRVLFVAEDSVQNGSGTLVEAAVDDIQILDLGPYATSVTNLNEAAVTVYPNPATTDLHIRTNELGAMKVSLVNALGQVVLSEEIRDYKNETVLSTASLSNGAYFLHIEINGKVSQQKVTIHHN